MMNNRLRAWIRLAGALSMIGGISILTALATATFLRQRAQSAARAELHRRPAAEGVAAVAANRAVRRAPGAPSAATAPEREPSTRSAAEAAKRSPAPGSPDGPALQARPDARRPLARIVIEGAGVDAVAFEGVSDEVLDRGVGHFPGTALPGQPGNASFAAHRDTLFRGLRHVREGERIDVETPGWLHRYRVTSTSVVEPTAVEVVAPRPGRHLTLVTCYPFNFVGPAPQRFVVGAEWVESLPLS